MANTYEYKPHQNPERERRRALAQAMMQRGMAGQPTQGPLAPIYGPADSAADIISALAGQRMNNKLQGEETADRDAYNKTMAEALRGPQAPVDGMGPTEGEGQFTERTLGSNPQTADIAMQMRMGRMMREPDEQFAPMSAEEMKSAGLRPGTVAYKSSRGNAPKIVQSPQEQSASADSWNNPVDEIVDGKPARVQYSNRGNRRVVPGAAPPSKAHSGGSITQDDEGNLVVTPGGRLTDAQSKTITYNVRASGALKNLEKIEGSGYDPANAQDRLADSTPMGNSMLTNSGQQYKQAASEFLAAILRKDTGAAVTKEEWTVYGEQFFPRYGDGADVKSQKAEARRRALEALQAGVGAAPAQPGGAQPAPSTGELSADEQAEYEELKRRFGR